MNGYTKKKQKQQYYALRNKKIIYIRMDEMNEMYVEETKQISRC